MLRRLSILVALIPLFALSALAAEVSTREVAYKADGVEMKGYLAKPSETGPGRPGVLVVHEWWGLNDYARMRARKLAELGYVSLAVDMYGGGKVTDHPKDAGEMSASVRKDPEGAAKRFEAALALLRAEPGVDPGKIAAIGYCFGGGVVLEMARRNLDLRGVASFHGSLNPATSPAKGPIAPKIAVFHGADDPMVSGDAVSAFQKEMTGAGADWMMVLYSKTKHSFTNPDADKFNIPGIAYNETADKRSWESMQDFLREILR